MAWFRRKSSAPKRVQHVEPVEGRRRLFFGRRYLADAPYMLPSDEQEINRLDFQHYMLRYAFKGNFAAPIGTPTSILDVGCGTGRWALEMAALFPGANVVGVDINPPPSETAAQQGHESRPENYTFLQADILQGLPFADASFDFTHQRLVYVAIPSARWPGLVADLVRVTRPGGWVELVEGGGLASGSGPAVETWVGWMSAASAKRGINFQQGGQVGPALRDAGLVSVTARELWIPAGKHGGRLGNMLGANFSAVIAAFRAPVVGAGMASEAMYDEVAAAVREEIANGQIFWPVYLAYGQKPR
jgi:SAM-dependent methyltransferase